MFPEQEKKFMPDHKIQSYIQALGWSTFRYELNADINFVFNLINDPASGTGTK